MFPYPLKKLVALEIILKILLEEVIMQKKSRDIIYYGSLFCVILIRLNIDSIYNLIIEGNLFNKMTYILFICISRLDMRYNETHRYIYRLVEDFI